MKNEDIVGSALAEVLPVTDKWWFQQSHLIKLNMSLLVPLLSSSVAGYDGSLMNGLQSLPQVRVVTLGLHGRILTTKQWQSYFGYPTGSLLGLVNAAQSIGSVLILPIVGWLSDRFGRKIVLLAGIFGVIIATIIQATSTTYAQFVVSRLIVGAAGMLVVQPAPMLIAELSYPTHRGRYTSAFWTMYYLGAILASWTTFGTQPMTSDWSWRIPTVLQAGFPLVQLTGYYFLPESPRWLIANDRKEEAHTILAKYHAAGDRNRRACEAE